MDLLADETGWSIVLVTRAKQWLLDVGAMVLVPYNKRVDDELKLPPRQHVYQLTGMIKLGDEIVPYLYLSEEQLKEINVLVVKVLDGKTLQDKVLDAKTKVNPSLSKYKKKSKSTSEVPPANNDKALAIKAYEECLGVIVPRHALEIAEYLNEGIDVNWIIDALGAAVDQNVRRWVYVVRILENWKKNGRNNGKSTNGNGHTPAAPVATLQRIYGDDCPECHGGKFHDGFIMLPDNSVKQCTTCWQKSDIKSVRIIE